MSDERKAEVRKVERELATLREELSVKLRALKSVPEGIDFAVAKSPRKDVELLQTEQDISAEITRLRACLVDAAGLAEFFSDAIKLVQQAQSSLGVIDKERDIKAANAAKDALTDFNETIYDRLIDINRDESKIPECTDELLQKLMIKDPDNNVLRHLNRDEIALWKAAWDQQESWNPFGSTDKIAPTKRMLFHCLTDTKLHMTAEIEKHSGRDIDRQKNVAKELMTSLSDSHQAAAEYQKEIEAKIRERQQKLESLERAAKKSVTPVASSAPVAPVQRAAEPVTKPVAHSNNMDEVSSIPKEKSRLDRLLEKISRGVDRLLEFCSSLKPSISFPLVKGLNFSLNKKAKHSHNVETESSNPTFVPESSMQRTEHMQVQHRTSPKSQSS